MWNKPGTSHEPPRFMATMLVALFAVFGVGACSNDSEAQPTAAADLRSLLGMNSLSSVSELQSFTLDIEEQITLCMKRLGFEYVPDVNVGVFDPQLGLSDLEYAERYGFGISAREIGEISSVTTIRYDESAAQRSTSDSEQDARRRALHGVPNSPDVGCLNEAVAAARPSQAQIDLATDLRADLREFIDSDGAVIRVMRQWADCMANEGSPYETHAAMEDDFKARAEQATTNQLDALRQEEMATALSALRCDDLVTSDLVKARSAAEAVFVAENSERIQEVVG